MVHAKMKQLLEDTEYEIIGFCRTGEDAIQSYREYRPDVVTMDIVMPGMDGLDAAKSILTEFPDANIVMISSLAYDDTMDAAEEMGAKGFIFKPFEREDLLEALDQATVEE
jgi:two-component system chemotaxis response regulator CheY